MNHRLLLATATLMTLPGCNSTPAAEATPASSFSVPVPESFRLANGLSVWLLSSKQVPVVSMSLVIRGGSSLDPKGKEGLVALTADMLDEGAGKRGPLEIADEVDFLGAELGVEAQKEYIEITLDTLRRNLDPALDIFADVVLRPTFSPKEWERVKALALNDLAQRREEARDVARVVSERIFYGDDHPYGHPVDGYEPSVKTIGLDEVKKFYAEHARPDRTVLLAVGDVTLDELRQRVESRFGGWKANGPAPKDLPETISSASTPSGPARLVIVDKPDAPQTEIRVIVPAPVRFSSPELAPLSLANTILGGTFTSRLVTNLRERNGFTYGASSVIVARSMLGHVVAGSAVYTDKTGPALAELSNEFLAMETGKLEPEELEKSRSTHKSHLVEAFESQDSTLNLYLPSAALGFGPAERKEFYARLAKATDEDIAKQSRDVYRWDRATIVLVGDRKAIEAQLADLKTRPLKDGKPCKLPDPELRGREGEPAKP